MEPVTLIATDLDGTFLNSKKQVSDLNREAVSKLKNHGILFGIASGRPVETVRAMLKRWKIEDSVSFITRKKILMASRSITKNCSMMPLKQTVMPIP